MIGPVFVSLSDNPKYANIVFLKVDVDEVQVGYEAAAKHSVTDTVCDLGYWSDFEGLCRAELSTSHVVLCAKH
jgi:hypothetical protein